MKRPLSEALDDYMDKLWSAGQGESDQYIMLNTCRRELGRLRLLIAELKAVVDERSSKAYDQERIGL